MSLKTIETYSSMLRRFMATRDPLQCSRDDIRDYVDEMRNGGLRSKTMSLRLSCLSSFWEWLVWEGLADENPVPPIRKRYMSVYKETGDRQTHKIISVSEAARLIDCAVDIRDKSLITMLLKTGIRLDEARMLDIDSIRWNDWSLLLNATKKRSNRIVYFDDEAAGLLKRWLSVREHRSELPGGPIWTTGSYRRISPRGVDFVVRRAAISAGLNDQSSPRMEDHFSPHCCRHWFTTHLLRNGMPREYVKELRGDARTEAIDIYNHIDREDLRRRYLACIPQLGV